MNEITQKKTSGFAIASLILGCFFIIPILGLLTSVLAIIFGIIALIMISNNRDTLKGNGLAISGLVLGVVGIIIIPIIAILAAIAIPNFARAKINAQDAFAESRVKIISTAIQTYASAHEGEYPSSLDELISSDSSSLPGTYSDKVVSGYSYSITFTDGGYSIKAEPQKCKITGTKIFTDHNGELSQENCR
jgi:type II secretory pathway pseudopilin PulG